jgi:hypothetical protein
LLSGTNSLPTITRIPDQVLNYNSSTGPLAFQISDVETPAGSLTVSRNSSNPGLVPTSAIILGGTGQNRTVAVTPAQGQSGSAVVTLTVSDPDGGASVETFTVTVNPPNAAPTLDALANISIDEDAGTQIVTLSGITSGRATENQELTVTATSSNPALIPAPAVSYTSPNVSGTIALAPAANASGNATITVTVNDGQALSNLLTRTFIVTVNAVNDPPTLNAINDVTINKNDGSQSVSLTGIGSGAANETEAFTVTAVSSNPGLLPNPVVTYASPSANGSLTFTPSRDASGSAVITVTVSDGGAQNNTTSRSFAVTIKNINAPPTLDPIANVILAEDASTQIVSLTGIGPGGGDASQPLTITASSSNPSLIPNPTVAYVSPNTTGSLTFTPVQNVTGSATITLTVNDGQSANNIFTRTFTVTVTGLNDPPAISNIPDRTISQNASSGPIGFTVTDVESPLNSLLLSAASSNPMLLPASAIVFGGSGSNRTVNVTPAQFQSGSAMITITVRDAEGGIAADSFTLTVTEANVPPTLNPLFNVTIPEDAGHKPSRYQESVRRSG